MTGPSWLSGLTWTSDPVWPWSLPLLGTPLFLAAAVLLVLLTVWTYSGVRAAKRGRVATVLALRLAALALAFLALLRPSLAFRDDLKAPSLLLFLVDGSQSMTIQDEFDGQSRWDYLQRSLRDLQPTLDHLRDEHNVNVQLYRFAGDVSELTPEQRPDGSRTDTGQALNFLFERHRSERFLRGLLLLSDGADNGTRFQPLALAQQWRNLPCPVHTVGFGKTTTSERQSDIALVAINPEPSPVPVKGQLTVKGTVDAPGFERARVRVQVLFDDKEVTAQDVELPNAQGNEIQVKTTAPSKPGEIKVTLRVQPLPGEVTEANNEISTFVTVTKEGVSVLLVDKPRAWDPQMICDALRADPRIRLYALWLHGKQKLDPEQLDLFQFDKQHYDVIILGDVSADRLRAGNPDALRTIRQLVSEGGTGLLMMGGYDSFGPSWSGTDIEAMLPVRLAGPVEQVERRVRLKPTEAGLRHYVLKLADHPADNALLWERLRELNGMTKLGPTKEGAVVLARDGDERDGLPAMVSQQFGAGRVLAFGGDSTSRWRNNPEGVQAFSRFWRQLVLWLAKQEETEGNVWVKPATRRLAAGGRLDLSAGVRGKGGVELKETQLQAKVVGPQGTETPVPLAREGSEQRGTFWKTDGPGEYRVVVRGTGKDTDGKEVSGEAAARFLVYQDDAEMVRRAADHDFLKKLAATGGGQFLRPDQIKEFLQKLPAQPLSVVQPKAQRWPDWKQNQLSGFVVGYFVMFVALLSLEWFLRRRWGMV